ARGVNALKRVPLRIDRQMLALVDRFALINADEPQDIYGLVIAKTRSSLETDDNEFAQWWRDHLDGREEKQIRKLLKTPIMTFAYSVSEIGMADQITEDYEKLFRPNRPIERKAACYLALKIMEACKEALGSGQGHGVHT